MLSRYEILPDANTHDVVESLQARFVRTADDGTKSLQAQHARTT
jgi:hypothetical protein